MPYSKWKEQFTLIKNEDMKRWEFYSNTDKYTSYLISFSEAQDEETAWVVVGLALLNIKVKRHLGGAENN
jgi:hypothetical protein